MPVLHDVWLPSAQALTRMVLAMDHHNGLDMRHSTHFARLVHLVSAAHLYAHGTPVPVPIERKCVLVEYASAVQRLCEEIGISLHLHGFTE